MSDKMPIPQRPRGRPKADEPGMNVSSWVRPSEYDRLVKMANQQDPPVSVSALVRSLLKLKIR